jgi:Transposase Tn5 dimerisation domain/Transposase DNA-binding
MNFTNKFFRDKRVTKRFENILMTMKNKPNSSLTSLCDERKDTVGVFRFLANLNFDVNSILNTYFNSVKKEINSMMKGKIDNRLLIIQDTTSVDLSNLEVSKKLGYLLESRVSKSNPLSQNLEYLKKALKKGISCHSAIAVTTNGEPVSLIDQSFITRPIEEFGKKKSSKKVPIDEKPSFRWIQTIQSVLNLKLKSKLIFIGDRESDITELLYYNFKEPVDLLIRGKSLRNVVCETNGLQTKVKIIDFMRNSINNFKFKTIIPRSKEENEKEIELNVFYQTITMQIPATLSIPKKYKKDKKDKEVKDISLTPYNCVLVENEDENISWILLTTLPITCENQVIEIIQFYKYRWMIERFHYILKSGYLVEDIQLESENAIKKVIALYSINSMKILRMTIKSRLHGQRPCTEEFTDDQWKAIYISTKKTKKIPNTIPSLNEIVRLLAKLGGFQGRKGDGEPGVKVLWRGLFALNHILKIYPLLVCKG